MSVEIAVLVSIIVLLVAVVSWLLINRRRDLSPTPTGQSPSKPPDQPTSDQRPVGYSQLVLGNTEKPLATVESLEAPIKLQRSPLPMNDQQIGWLQSIFKHAPRLAKSGSGATRSTYMMKFSPDVARGIRNGSLEIMKSAQGGLRGIVVDAQGKIVSQATLVSASSVSMTAVAAGAFQVFAVVTAQYYLPQINRRLSQIERGVHDLQAHLTAQDKATLIGGLKQLRSVKLLLEEGNLHENDMVTSHVNLDAIDRDGVRITEVYRDRMQRHRSELDELKLSGAFAPDFDAAIAKSTEYENAAFICLQAMYVRSLTAQFRYAMPGDDVRVSQARHDLRELEAELKGWQEGLAAFFERFKERIENDTIAYLDLGDLGELLGQEDSHTKERARIVYEAGERRVAVTAPSDELSIAIDLATKHAARRLSAASTPLTLAVEVDEKGDIEYVYELAETT